METKRGKRERRKNGGRTEGSKEGKMKEGWKGGRGDLGGKKWKRYALRIHIYIFGIASEEKRIKQINRTYFKVIIQECLCWNKRPESVYWKDNGYKELTKNGQHQDIS